MYNTCTFIFLPNPNPIKSQNPPQKKEELYKYRPIEGFYYLIHPYPGERPLMTVSEQKKKKKKEEKKKEKNELAQSIDEHAAKHAAIENIVFSFPSLSLFFSLLKLFASTENRRSAPFLRG